MTPLSGLLSGGALEVRGGYRNASISLTASTGGRGADEEAAREPAPGTLVDKLFSPRSIAALLLKSPQPPPPPPPLPPPPLPLPLADAACGAAAGAGRPAASDAPGRGETSANSGY